MAGLTKEQIARRQELTARLAAKSLTKPEAEELKQLLETEKKNAIGLGDVIALLAIGFLIVAVLAFLFGDKSS